MSNPQPDHPAESKTVERIGSLNTGESYPIPRRRRLGPPRVMTGRERRRINPNNGLIKVLERKADLLISRFIYPRLAHFWAPYTSVLHRRFTLAETAISPRGWPKRAGRLRVLLLSDIHAGIFLAPS
ncbi:MAG TPA: hypothetical protein VNO43_03155, partial [Candidatus Eisenbacteria bacterium]|nr:hypothetical protein [Candidatus Eisenbacteria bacterium]